MKGHQLAPGDVVVSHDTVTGRGYTLSVAPDRLSQLWYASYEQAVKAALAWAAASGVRVWRVNGASGFEPVEPHPKPSRTRES